MTKMNNQILLSIQINFHRQQKMTQQLSHQHLLTCLKQKDKYKGTQTYIQEALKFNEDVYPMINKALVSSLIDKSSKPMHRLYALRFFKEILITGNISLIDGLDQSIEECILNVAMYNKKSKELNRGANYFTQVQGQKNNQDNQRVGSSYVLLATQLIAVFSRWYNKDEENQLTRFAYYVQDLKKEGINLPNQNQSNFFKKEEEQKFNKNYTKWLKYIAELQQKQIQKSQPKINEQITNNNKNEELPVNTLNVSNNIVINNNSNVNHEKSRPLSLSNTPVTQNRENMQSSQKMQSVEVQGNKQLKNSAIKKENQVKKLNNQPNQVDQIKRQIIEDNKNVINDQGKSQNLMKKLSSIQQELQRKNQQISKLQSQIHKFKQRQAEYEKFLKDKQNMIKVLQDQKNNLAKSNVYEIKPQDQGGDLKQSKITEKKIIQSYVITILPPKHIDELVEQNQLLKEIVETTEQLMQKQSRQFKKQIQDLKQENVDLKNLLKSKQSQKSNASPLQVQQANSSFLVLNDIKLQNAKKMTQHEINLIKDKVMQQDRNNEQIMNMSVSRFLKQNQEQKLFEKTMEPRSKSLKKTQSLKNFYRKQPLNSTNNFNHTKLQKFNNTTQNKLLKVSNGFSQYNYANSNKMATVFPFLQDYFPQAHKIVPNFKEFCLSKSDKMIPYYENNELRISLTSSKQNNSQVLIQIENKTLIDKSIKVSCDSNQKGIVGSNVKRLRIRNKVQFVYRKDEINLNFRFPIINITIKNQDHNQHTIKLPLPFTLLNYIQVSPYFLNSTQKQSKQIKLSAFSKQPNFHQTKKLFPDLNLRQYEQQINITGLLKLNRSQAIIQMNQLDTQIMSTIYCKQNDVESTNFGKVILQLIMFLLK